MKKPIHGGFKYRNTPYLWKTIWVLSRQTCLLRYNLETQKYHLILLEHCNITFHISFADHITLPNCTSNEFEVYPKYVCWKCSVVHCITLRWKWLHIHEYWNQDVLNVWILNNIKFRRVSESFLTTFLVLWHTIWFLKSG